MDNRKFTTVHGIMDNYCPWTIRVREMVRVRVRVRVIVIVRIRVRVRVRVQLLPIDRVRINGQ